MLRELRQGPEGSYCEQLTGIWEVEAGWRYEDYGGGIVARVRLQLETTRTVTVELSNEAPDAGYIDGIAYVRSRDLAPSCP